MLLYCSSVIIISLLLILIEVNHNLAPSTGTCKIRSLFSFFSFFLFTFLVYIDRYYNILYFNAKSLGIFK